MILLICWRKALYIHRIDAVSRQTMGQLLRCVYTRHHHQQTLHKHTQADNVDDKAKKRNQTKSSTYSNKKISSIPYTKEQSLAKMQLKHLQYYNHKFEKPVTETTAVKNALNSGNTAYSLDWVFERLKNPNRLWYIFSQIVVFAVGLFSKLVLVFMNKTNVYNRERLIEAVCKRPPGVPLVTVSNHHSCFDDPGLWGVLPVRFVCNSLKMRWSMAAHDICFTNKYHSSFFMLGKCIPVIRGHGVYQDAVDICVQKLKLGDWVHVFPEGKVNMTKEEMRLKWGVGRIIYESSTVPIILPMWHEGMDEVLPNTEPYLMKWGKRVTLNIGKPMDLNYFICDLKSRGITEPEARKLITDKIQDIFHNLRLETQELHNKK